MRLKPLPAVRLGLLALPAAAQQMAPMPGMASPADKAFASAMAELQYGTDPALQQVAQDIIGFQTTEINELEAWQAEHLAGQ